MRQPKRMMLNIKLAVDLFTCATFPTPHFFVTLFNNCIVKLSRSIPFRKCFSARDSIGFWRVKISRWWHDRCWIDAHFCPKHDLAKFVRKKFVQFFHALFALNAKKKKRNCSVVDLLSYCNYRYKMYRQ